MLLRRLEEVAQHLGRLLESLGEFPLLLIPPGRLQIAQPPVQPADEALQLVVEPRKILSKSPQLDGIDMGFGHEMILAEWQGDRFRPPAIRRGRFSARHRVDTANDAHSPTITAPCKSLSLMTRLSTCPSQKAMLMR